MERRTIRSMDETALMRFQEYLMREERAPATCARYQHDVRLFLQYRKRENIRSEVTKEQVIGFKEYLLAQYRARSVNSMLTAVNCFLEFMGWPECRVRLMKIQRQMFAEEERELKKEEYYRLVEAARKAGKRRLEMILQTLCGLGLRISELAFVTVEAVRRGRLYITNKGKNRMLYLPKLLQKELQTYVQEQRRENGPVFTTRSGRPVDRSNVWREMKTLREEAAVPPEKIFPHNLRHLFARTFYEMGKDVMKLAALLGHSSIETTRIYTATSGRECRQQMEEMGLVRWHVQGQNEAGDCEILP